MKYLILVSAIAALASAQHDHDICHCGLGAHLDHDHHDEVTEIFELKGDWDHGCDDFSESVCREECDVRKKQLEELGGWHAPAGEHRTVGDDACEKIGHDVKDLHSFIMYSVCGHDNHVSEMGFMFPLCCEDGKSQHC